MALSPARSATPAACDVSAAHTSLRVRAPSDSDDSTLLIAELFHPLYNSVVERLKHFFNGIVQRAFSELGLAEKPIVDHVTDVLADFANVDHLYRLRSMDGKRVDSLVSMMIELPG